MTPGPAIFTSVLPLASILTPKLESLGRLQPVGGFATSPVIVCPLRRSLMWSAPKAIHGFAPARLSGTVQVTSPTNWLSSVIVTVIEMFPLRSVAWAGPANTNSATKRITRIVGAMLRFMTFLLIVGGGILRRLVHAHTSNTTTECRATEDGSMTGVGHTPSLPGAQALLCR